MQDHSRQNLRRTAPDYTNAALIMGFINLLWSLLLVRANFGLAAALVLAVFLNYLITRLAQSRARMH